MTTVPELQKAIPGLTAGEFAELSRWLVEQDWVCWEQEFDEDVKGGKLDALAAEALAAKADGQLTDLFPTNL